MAQDDAERTGEGDTEGTSTWGYVFDFVFEMLVPDAPTVISGIVCGFLGLKWFSWTGGIAGLILGYILGGLACMTFYNYIWRRGSRSKGKRRDGA